MKSKVARPFFFLIAFVLIVGMACMSSTETPEPASQPEASEPDSGASESNEPAQASPSGAVSNLQDARGAVIQIEAQGTFVDPEYGEYFGAGSGSGFIIDPSGIAVTNNHVVTGAATLTVYIGGDRNKPYNAKILGVSECSDLAVIDIEGEGFPYLEWYSGNIDVGLEIYTAGFPLGEPEYTLSKGIVAKESAGGDTNWASISEVIMHDATINPGNSGGPLVTSDGKIVAVNYRGRIDQDQYFAIGRDVAVPIIDQLKTAQDVNSIGVNGTAVIWGDSNQYSGIWVASVASGSPAQRAGITGGDVIISLEGTPLGTDGTLADYCKVIRTQGHDSVIAVEVMRPSTGEFLEGQLNGTLLQVTYAPPAEGSTSEGSSSEGSTGGSSSTGTTTEGFVGYNDNLGALYIEVPANWTDGTGDMWEATWKSNFSFQAANIILAPNYQDFIGYWSSPGVDFAASADWGKIGGYIQLLDDAGYSWYEGNCEKTGRYDYTNTKFEGKFDVWDCGVGADVIVLGARPITNSSAYLVLLQIQLGDDWGGANDYIAQHISETFDVVGTLP